MSDRYADLFARLASEGRGAFVPFVVLGDPDRETSDRILDALVEGGADALELGIPHSDPIADGPVIQRAGVRALEAGATVDTCLEQLRGFRSRHPEIPVGILTYANLALARGDGARGLEKFYSDLAAAGVDSALLADVPVEEAQPFVDAARTAGVHPILIAPPDADDVTLEAVARFSSGYVYCTARAGVTGTHDELGNDAFRLFERLRALAAAPPLLGFGISSPEHVHKAIAAGAAGAISGSAVVATIEERLEGYEDLGVMVRDLVQAMANKTDPNQ